MINKEMRYTDMARQYNLNYNYITYLVRQCKDRGIPFPRRSQGNHDQPRMRVDVRDDLINTTLSINDLAIKYNLTRQRIYQIINNLKNKGIIGPRRDGGYGPRTRTEPLS